LYGTQPGGKHQASIAGKTNIYPPHQHFLVGAAALTFQPLTA
jgi:hypothetical protein